MVYHGPWSAEESPCNSFYHPKVHTYPIASNAHCKEKNRNSQGKDHRHHEKQRKTVQRPDNPPHN